MWNSHDTIDSKMNDLCAASHSIKLKCVND